MPSLAVVALSLVVLAVTYAWRKFTTRVSPNIPYAGSPTNARAATLSERLRVPQEYAKDPVQFLCKTRAILGDVFCVDLLAAKIVFTLGADGNRGLLRAADEKLSFDDAIKWSMGPTVVGSEFVISTARYLI